MATPVILIVDDDVNLLKLLSRLLGVLEADVIMANGGAQALDVLDEEVPDLLLLDLAMPGVRGEDVLEHVRSDPRFDTMKVMILTARPNALQAAVAVGVDDWMAKPISHDEFLEKVRWLLADFYL
ncbi:MAG: response regulator [Chloroflexi bacterium]|nr:response regulator [Chloroflexota bacterium]